MADYLTDEEQAERLKGWWDRYGTSLIAALALAVAGVVGWRYYQDFAGERAAAAATAYAAYVDARAAGEDAAEAAAVLDGDHAGAAYHVLSLLYRAADQAAEEDWAEALAFLERAIELADAGPVRDIARYRAAKVLFQLDRLADGSAMLARISSPGLEAQVAELSGDMALAKGDPEAAREAYRTGAAAARGRDGRQLPGLALIELKLASVVGTGETADQAEGANPVETTETTESET